MPFKKPASKLAMKSETGKNKIVKQVKGKVEDKGKGKGSRVKESDSKSKLSSSRKKPASKKPASKKPASKERFHPELGYISEKEWKAQKKSNLHHEWVIIRDRNHACGTTFMTWPEFYQTHEETDFEDAGADFYAA